jgi:hypothetical protein
VFLIEGVVGCGGRKNSKEKKLCSVGKIDGGLWKDGATALEPNLPCLKSNPTEMDYGFVGRVEGRKKLKGKRKGGRGMVLSTETDS